MKYSDSAARLPGIAGSGADPCTMLDGHPGAFREFGCVQHSTPLMRTKGNSQCVAGWDNYASHRMQVICDLFHDKQVRACVYV